MRVDGRLIKGQVGAVTAGENEEQIWDDVAGEPRESEGVRKARSEDLEEFRKHEVCKKVPVTRCIEVTGKRTIGTRWIDVNIGDQVHPGYRS